MKSSIFMTDIIKEIKNQYTQEKEKERKSKCTLPMEKTTGYSSVAEPETVLTDITRKKSLLLKKQKENADH